MRSFLASFLGSARLVSDFPYQRRMNFLSEFRHPTTWYSKLAAALLALGFFTLLATGAVGSYLVYHIVAPIKTDQTVDLAQLPGRPEDFSYDVAGLGSREAWFFPGLKSGPTSPELSLGSLAWTATECRFCCIS